MLEVVEGAAWWKILEQEGKRGLCVRNRAFALSGLFFAAVEGR